jgi:hypothetical protein
MRLSLRIIYDTYLYGPVAVMRLFEQPFGTLLCVDLPPLTTSSENKLFALIFQANFWSSDEILFEYLSFFIRQCSRESKFLFQRERS